jgi:hypothetical protein
MFGYENNEKTQHPVLYLNPKNSGISLEMKIPRIDNLIETLFFL